MLFFKDLKIQSEIEQKGLAIYLSILYRQLIITKKV